MRHPHALVVAHEQQLPVLAVLPHHVDRLIGQAAADDRRPRGAVVGRPEQVRREVVLTEPVLGDKGRARLVARREHAAHPAVAGPAGLRDGRASRRSTRPPCVRVTCTLPSSVPIQMTPASRGDSEIVVIVQYWMLPRPKVFAASSVVRSGLISCHASPRLSERSSTWAPGVDDLRVVRRERERRVPVPAQRRLTLGAAAA